MLTAGFACTAGYREPTGQDGGSRTGSTGHRGQGWSKAPRSKKNQSVHPQHVLTLGASGSECRAGPLAVLGTDTATWVQDRGAQGTGDKGQPCAGGRFGADRSREHPSGRGRTQQGGGLGPDPDPIKVQVASWLAPGGCSALRPAQRGDSGTWGRVLWEGTGPRAAAGAGPCQAVNSCRVLLAGSARSLVPCSELIIR